MCAVVVPAPRCCNDVLAFDNLKPPAKPAKLGRSGQTSGRSSDTRVSGSSTHRSDTSNCSSRWRGNGDSATSGMSGGSMWWNGTQK